MIASEVMTADPVSVEVSEPISRAIEIFNEMDIRHLPIVERGVLVGVLSDRDLRSNQLSLFRQLEDPQAAAARYREPVSTLMSGDVISVSTESEITDVIQLMIDHKFGAVPVVDPTEGTLVGIISYVDILREAQELF